MHKMNFEEAMKKLEQLVEELEAGDFNLDESLEKFKEGMELSVYCNKKIDEIEKKISILIEQSDGKIVERPFNVSEEV